MPPGNGMGSLHLVFSVVNRSSHVLRLAPARAGKWFSTLNLAVSDLLYPPNNERQKVR
jgi:hypothetical protein